jgi:hypothetical protein
MAAKVPAAGKFPLAAPRSHGGATKPECRLGSQKCVVFRTATWVSNSVFEKSFGIVRNLGDFSPVVSGLLWRDVYE